MNTPLVSIIIPTYNRAHLIGETLDSIIDQTYTNWECIVVDDGSSDKTDTVLGQYMEHDSRIRYVHRSNEHLPGGNGARNYGLELSKGEYIQWFDSDDLMLSSFLADKLKLFKENINFVICAGSYLLDSSKVEPFDVVIQQNIYRDYVLWKTSIFTPSVMFRKIFLKKHGLLFNEQLKKGQETEFLSKIFFVTKPNEYMVFNKSLFYYRRHAQTKSVENQKYVLSYKWSIAYNHLENFKRGLLLNDGELIKYFYKKSLKTYRSALQNTDEETCSLIWATYKKTLFKKNKLLSLKFRLYRVLCSNKIYFSNRLFEHLKYLNFSY